MFLMCAILQFINNAPNDVPEFPNLVFLLVHRPIFIAGFTMLIFPILVAPPKTPCRPLHNFLGHSFWVPFSRLSYGAFLSHGIWMQFHDFNTERGTWGCGLDAFLFFLAYLAFSFLFAFLAALVWEQPIASLWYAFVLRPIAIDQQKRARQRDQVVAKSVYNTSVQGESSVKDIIESRKRQLAGGEEISENGLLISRKKRKGSGDTEDLEGEGSQTPGSPEVQQKKKLYSYKPKK